MNSLRQFAYPHLFISEFQVQGLEPVLTDCSSTGTGQLVTQPVNLKIIKGEPQKLKVQFEILVSGEKNPFCLVEHSLI